ncbi:MAG: hypothetical protein ABI783_02200 [Actinomycetota bacterium]
MSVLGVRCAGDRAFLAVVEEPGKVSANTHARLILPSALQRPEALQEFIEQLAGEIRATAVDRVALVHPTYGRRPQPYGPRDLRAAFERGGMHVLVEMAAGKAGVPVELTTSQRIRGRLRPANGVDLDDLAGSMFGANPPYWADRKLAALAAEAVSR